MCSSLKGDTPLLQAQQDNGTWILANMRVDVSVEAPTVFTFALIELSAVGKLY